MATWFRSTSNWKYGCMNKYIKIMTFPSRFEAVTIQIMDFFYRSRLTDTLLRHLMRLSKTQLAVALVA